MRKNLLTVRCLVSFLLVFILVLSPLNQVGAQDSDEGLSDSTESSDPDADADGVSDADEAAASEAAAADVGAAAAAAGVDVDVSAVDTTNNPASPGGTSVDVNGVSMSVEAAMEAIGTMAAANAAGMSPATGNAPGYDVNATLEAHAQGEYGSVVGNLSGEIGSPAEVAHAEIDTTIGLETSLNANTTPAATTQQVEAVSTPSVQEALSYSSALTDPTPMAEQGTLSAPSLDTVDVSNTSMTGATPGTLSTTNEEIDATSFSLENYSYGVVSTPEEATVEADYDPSTETTTQDPANLDDLAQGYLGAELGRMATQEAIAEAELEALEAQAATGLLGLFTETAPEVEAAIAAKEAEIEAIDARMEAALSPTVTNQAVASLEQDKANALEDLSEAMNAAVANEDKAAIEQTLETIEDTKEMYSTLVEQSIEDPEHAAETLGLAAAQAERDVASALGTTVDVDPLGTLTEPNSIAATENLETQVTNGLVDVGLSPEVAVSTYNTIQGLLDVATMGITSITTSIIDYVDYSTAAKNATDPATKEALENLAAQAVKEAVAVGYTSLLGGMAFGVPGMAAGLTSAGKSVGSTVDNAVSTIGKTENASVSATTQTTKETVSVSYNYETNTVTVSTPEATQVSQVVEGRMASAVDDISPAVEVSTPEATPAAQAVDDISPAVEVSTPEATPAAQAVDDLNPAVEVSTPEATPAAQAVDSTLSSPAAATVDDLVSTPAPEAAPAATAEPAPASSASQAVNSTVSVAMAVVEALSAPMSANVGTLTQAFTSVIDDFVATLSRTADDIDPNASVTISSTVENVATPVDTPATASAVDNVDLNPAVGVSAPEATPAAQAVTTDPSAENVAEPLTEQQFDDRFNGVASSYVAEPVDIPEVVTVEEPTVLGTVQVDLPEELGQTSTLGTSNTATLTSNPATGMVDVTIEDQPNAQVQSLTQAQALEVLATYPAAVEEDFINQAFSAVFDFFSPPNEVTGTFSLSLNEPTATPVSVEVVEVQVVDPTPTVSPEETAQPLTDEQFDDRFNGIEAPNVEVVEATPASPDEVAQTPDDIADPVAAETTPEVATPDQATASPDTASLVSENTPAAPADPDVVGVESYANVEVIAPEAESSLTQTAIAIAEGAAAVFNEVLGVNPAQSEPLGVTQNNPTNIRETNSNDWLGEVNDGPKAFETFATPAYGYRAAFLIQQSYERSGITTVRGRIEKATPLFENPTQPQYIERVARHMGINPDTPFSIMNKEQAVDYMEAVTREEVGNNHSFTRADIESGFDMAVSGSQTEVAGTPNITQAQAVQAAKQVAAGAIMLSQKSPTALAANWVLGSLLERVVQGTTPASAPSASRGSILDRALNSPTVTRPQAEVPSVTTSPSATTQVDRVVMRNQNATRDRALTDTLNSQLSYAATKANVVFVVTSGGQASKAEVARGLARLTERTGSDRHDDGRAADGTLVDPSTGRVLDFTNPQDLPTFVTFVRAAVEAGATGVGAGVQYMGSKTIHVGGGSSLAWGHKAPGVRQSTTAPSWLREAHRLGLEDAKSFNLNEYLAGQPNTTVAVPASITSIPTPTARPASTQAESPTLQPSTQNQQVSSSNTSQPAAPNSQNPSGVISTNSNNAGTPPQNFGNPGPGAPSTLTTPASMWQGIRSFVAGTLAGIIETVADIGSDDTEEEPDVTESTNDPEVAPNTSQPTSNPNTTLSNFFDFGGSDSFAAPTSTQSTVNVLIQIDGNTGDIYFAIDAVYDANGNLRSDFNSYGADEPETDEVSSPSIVLDDSRQSVVYSDGTYAPVTINGVVYESEDDPNYVYTVEYYVDGELMPVKDDTSAVPGNNALSNLLGGLFSSDANYDESDVALITRKLTDPDSELRSDEYYTYIVYLRNGSTRKVRVPQFASYRLMSEEFADTGFEGNVLSLIAQSVELDPESGTSLISGVVETLGQIGLTVVDWFQGEDEENPLVTDFGSILPSADGVIDMDDIASVLVVLDVEATCPDVAGLSRAYLYEVIISAGAIEGSTVDQAFRAVRCGGGDKDDFVEQVAGHFETYSGVGDIDRDRLYDLMLFVNYEDLDFSALLEEDEEPLPEEEEEVVEEVPEGEEEGTLPNRTNEVTFEVKAVGSQGQVLLDWTTSSSISIGNGVQLYFRWDGTSYQQCLPFLNDRGDYALNVTNRAMLTGNTESELYDIREASTTYRLECGGQRNNEYGVDVREIGVVVE